MGGPLSTTPTTAKKNVMVTFLGDRDNFFFWTTRLPAPKAPAVEWSTAEVGSLVGVGFKSLCNTASTVWTEHSSAAEDLLLLRCCALSTRYEQPVTSWYSQLLVLLVTSLVSFHKSQYSVSLE